jgi:hypothetical protein
MFDECEENKIGRIMRDRIEATKSNSAPFKTIKAAKQAGFRDVRPNDYAGELIVIKDHPLIRDPKQAQSATAWKKDGFAPIDPNTYYALRYHQLGSMGPGVSYPVYADDQVRPRPRRK